MRNKQGRPRTSQSTQHLSQNTTANTLKTIAETETHFPSATKVLIGVPPEHSLTTPPSALSSFRNVGTLANSCLFTSIFADFTVSVYPAEYLLGPCFCRSKGLWWVVRTGSLLFPCNARGIFGGVRPPASLLLSITCSKRQTLSIWYRRLGYFPFVLVSCMGATIIIAAIVGAMRPAPDRSADPEPAYERCVLIEDHIMDTVAKDASALASSL